MDITQITAFLLILGNMFIVTGFRAFPAYIYTGKNVQKKLDLLAAQPQRWVLSQLLIILGALILVAGSLFLVSLFSESQGVIPARIGAVGFVFGQIFWIWIVGLRIVEPWRAGKR